MGFTFKVFVCMCFKFQRKNIQKKITLKINMHGGIGSQRKGERDGRTEGKAKR